jgi:hypothetical protein
VAKCFVSLQSIPKGIAPKIQKLTLIDKNMSKCEKQMAIIAGIALVGITAISVGTILKIKSLTSNFLKLPKNTRALVVRD